VLIYNLKPPQVTCAKYAARRLGLPVILEYEDDQFLPLGPGASRFSTGELQLMAARRLLTMVSGCIAGSPALLSQVREGVPKLLLPGVVGGVMASPNGHDGRRNRVVFSGTHSSFQGLEQLVKAWKIARLPDWQLHIAGHGGVTAMLHELAADDPTIVFHGVLNRQDNAHLLASGKLTVVPYEVNMTQGFSFKTLECLGAGLHVISTPLTALEGLEPELKCGITYITDNAPETIATCLRTVIAERRYEVTVQQATVERYGPGAVARSLDTLLKDVLTFRATHNGT